MTEKHNNQLDDLTESNFITESDDTKTTGSRTDTDINTNDRGEFDPLVRLGLVKTPEESRELIDDYDKAINSTKDLIKAGPGRFLKGIASRSGKKSIIGMAAKNTFEFPVFISKSVPLDYATATNSLLEQIYGAYLQMAISLQPVIDSKTAKTGGPFAKFKTNVTKYVEYTDMFYAHDAAYACYQNDGIITEFSMLSITDQDAQIINEAVDYQPLSEFDHFFQEMKQQKSNFTADQLKGSKVSTDENQNVVKTVEDNISDYDVAKANKEFDILNAEFDKLNKERAKLNKELAALERNKDFDEATLENRKQLLLKQLDQTEQQAMNAWADSQKKLTELGFEIDSDGNIIKTDDAVWKSPDGKYLLTLTNEIKNKRLKLIRDTAKAQADLELAAKQLDSHDERMNMERERMDMERERHAKDMMVHAPQFLDETKIQKLNTMKPLMMQVQLKVADRHGGISAPVEYIVGIKTHARLIEPEILPEVASYPLKQMNQISRRAKWRAGEIKFLDYVFKIGEKKQTAVDARDPKRKWYRRLYELAHKKGDSNVAARISGNNHSGLIPNATIIMSQTDVDNIKEMTNINLLNGSAAKKFCNELFLMALIIEDLDSECIKILLPDINNEYEVHSLASVKKQLATLDTTGDKARDMFKLLGK